MKRYVPSILVLLTAFGGMTPALAQVGSTTVSLVVDGHQVSSGSRAMLVDGHVMVPIDGVPAGLGASVDYDKSSGNIVIRKGSKTILLTIGSILGLQNGLQIRIETAPIHEGDTVWIPIESVTSLLGGDTEWVSASNTLVLSTNGPIVAEGTNQKELPLTYDKALEMALATSHKVQNALEDVSRSKEVLDKAAQHVRYIPAQGGDVIGTKKFVGYTQAAIAYGISQKAYGMAQDVITYAVKQAYNGILQAQAQQQAAEAALKNAQVQANIATVGHQYGTVSDIQWQQAMQGLQAAKAGLEAANKAVTDAYQRLNSLTGLPTDAKYQVVDQPQVDDLKNVDPEAQVARVTSDSPAIWQAEQQVNLAKLQLDLYTFNDPTNPDPYEAKQIDVQKAYNSEADLKDQLSRAVRSAYNGLLELRDQYQSLQSQLAAAEQSLKLAQIQYQYGTGIQADVVAAQAKVDQLKQQLANTAAQFDNLKMVFEKPWVAGGSGSTSGTSSGGSAG
ncbi:MAG TPA: TolC family protein [Alicyclobacillus sp.]|nr:TolC family protein [Alicyclobacillus sp.]